MDVDQTCVILYSAPGMPSGWNPLPARIRYALKFKGINHKVIWLEYPDIEPTLRNLNASPTGTWPDGRPFYSVPVIIDPTHPTEDDEPRVISDSWTIAMYLDDNFPSRNKLFPDNTKALQMLFQRHIHKTLYIGTLARILTPQVLPVLSPVSQEYFKSTRETLFSSKLEEICPEGSEQWGNGWKAVSIALDDIANILEENGSGATFVLGDQPSYADFVLVTVLDTVWTILPTEYHERIEISNDGRWKELREKCAMWREV